MQSEIDNIFELSLKEHPWTTADIGTNSISSLITTKLPAGIEVGKVLIPQPNDDAIKTYLVDMKDALEAYGRHKALGKAAFEGFPQFEDEDLAEDLDLPNLKITKALDKEERTRMVFSSPLKTIPTELFGREDFNLNEPNTFSEVANYQDLIGLNNAKTETIHHELNERLCLYRDTIQLKLLREISNRTSLFLESLKSLQSLRKETQDALATIKSLEDKLADIKDYNVVNGLQIIKLKQRLGIQSKLYAVVDEVDNIKKNQPEIENLLQQKLYTPALEMIMDCYESLNCMQIEQEKAPQEIVPGVSIVKSTNMTIQNLEVMNVTSIAEQSAQIDEIAKNAAMSMITDFCETILKDYKSQIEQPTPLGSGGGLVNASIQKLEIGSIEFVPPTPLAVTSAFPVMEEISLGPREQLLKNSLKEVTSAILKTDTLPMTIEFCKESYIREIKRMSETFYPRDAAQEKTIGGPTDIYEKLRAMNFETFFSILIKHYVFYLKVLRHFSSVIHVICKNVEEAEISGVVIGQFQTNLVSLPTLDTKLTVLHFPDEDVNSQSMVNLLNDKDDHTAKSDNPFKQIIKDAQSAVQHVMEFCQKKCAKLILSRTDQNEKLSTTDFHRLYYSSMEFLNTGEQLCGRHCFELKKALTSQINVVVKNFHEEKTTILADTLQSEPWVSVEVPPEFHALLDDIQKHNLKSLPSLPVKKQSELLPTGELTLAAAKPLTVSTDTIHDGKNTFQYLQISEQKFYVVSASLTALKLLSDYLYFSTRLPAVEVPITSKIIEFLQVTLS